LAALYSHVCVALIDGGASDLQLLREIPNAHIVTHAPRGQGRYAVMQAAVTTSAHHIHYVDMDRLLRWVETNPAELAQAVERIVQVDCLILGRSGRAFATHPRSLQETEKISNLVFSHLLRQPLDLGGGSRGLSRSAAQFVLDHSAPEAWGDAAWPVLLHRAGFALSYLAVDGLDWESADRYRPTAADAETQRQLADQLDQDAGRWALRVQIAYEIVREGLAAYNEPPGQ
jgi:hypothetical protein